MKNKRLLMKFHHFMIPKSFVHQSSLNNRASFRESVSGDDCFVAGKHFPMKELFKLSDVSISVLSLLEEQELLPSPGATANVTRSFIVAAVTPTHTQRDTHAALVSFIKNSLFMLEDNFH